MQSLSIDKEYVIICIDNSDMINTFYTPMFEAIEAISISIISENDEKLFAGDFNYVAIMELSPIPQIIGTFTRDLDIIRESLNKIQTNTGMNFIRGIQTAISKLVSHLINKSDYRMRIIVFVCSSIKSDQNELEVLAKSIRKTELDISVDIVNFGNKSIVNKQKLKAFIKALNPTSRLYNIENPQNLKNALNDSLIIKGNEITPNQWNQYFANTGIEEEEEDWQFRKAIEESLKDCKSGSNSKFCGPNIMSEDEQLALAINMSLSTTNEVKKKRKKFIEGKKEPK